MFVTTIIPVYNGERFIAATLESVGRQTRLPDRLVVQDNCSTDNTAKLVAAFQKAFPRVRCEFKRNEQNIGGLGNFNRALKFAEDTDVLHILSADDLIKPTFFERLLPLFDDVHGYGLVHCELEFIDENGLIAPPLPRQIPAGVEELTRLQFLRRQAELRHVYCQSVLLHTGRKPAPAFFRTDMLQASDVIFFAEWATHCERVRVLREPLCQYRVHAQSTTGGNINKLEAWVLEEWRAMEIIAEFIRKEGFSDRLHREKRKSIFAARSKVKMQMVQQRDPAYSAAIRDAARRVVGPLHWALGCGAVLARDLLKGRHPAAA
ncbi:MAG TPA: glycosyltransferase [Methylomirabilota bacterium]|nr:glycosyltransferase [Methylomirabilota bacterium]